MIESRGLGRKHVPDERDWSFAQLAQHIADKTPAVTPATTLQQLADAGITWREFESIWKVIKSWFRPAAPGRVWEELTVLDQGNSGECVGHGWAGWGNAAPIEDHYTHADALKIYLEATTIDSGQPDVPPYEAGSTVRSGAKAMKARGKLSAYAFETDITAVMAWLQQHGPVVFGTNWLTGMDNPNAQGLVYATGSVRGGHCYHCLGVTADGLLEFQNSWGPTWGVKGRFYMTQTDAAKLLADQGEACAAAEV